MAMHRQSMIAELADCFGFVTVLGCLFAALRYTPAIEAFIIELKRGL